MIRFLGLGLTKRAQGGLHHARRPGGVGTQSGGHRRSDLGLHRATERIHDGVVRGNHLCREHRLKQVCGAQRQQGEARDVAADGAGAIGVAGRDGFDNGVNEGFKKSRGRAARRVAGGRLAGGAEMDIGLATSARWGLQG